MLINVLSGQHLIPFSTDTIKVKDDFIIDDLMTISNTPGDVFILDYNDDLYLGKKEMGYELERLNYSKFILPYSLSKYENQIVFYGGEDDRYEIKLYDISAGKTIKSKNIEKKHSITPAHIFQDENSAYIIHYYFNESNPNKAYDLVRVYKYSKKRNKVKKKTYIDVGPESVLSPLGYQMVGHFNGKTYIATSLSGSITVLDEDLNTIDKLLVDSIIARNNQSFIDSFLSDEKIKGFFRRPRKVILDFKRDVPSDLMVLSRILPLPDDKIFLQYSDPNNIKSYQLFVYDIKNKTKQSLIVNQKYQQFFHYDLTLNNIGNIQAISLESDSTGETYYLITTFSLVEDRSLLNNDDLNNCMPEIDLVRDNIHFLLLDLPTYCSGCISQEFKNKMMYFALEKHVIDEHINRSYMEKTFKASLHMKGDIIYIDEDKYSCLKKFMQVNQVYYLGAQ